jgi:hypothetical protein
MRAFWLFLVVLTIVLIFWYRVHHKHVLRSRPVESVELQKTQVRTGPSDIYPKAMLTPGASNPNITQANILQTICNPDRLEWQTKMIRPPRQYTNRLKREQMEEYGYADPQPNDFEEDHLIPLELGGDPTDPKNLWPEPYKTSIPEGGARYKDQVENYLHKQVCSGNISLEEAQKEIAFDWYVVYVTQVSPAYRSGSRAAREH